MRTFPPGRDSSRSLPTSRRDSYHILHLSSSSLEGSDIVVGSIFVGEGGQRLLEKDQEGLGSCRTQ